MKWTRIIFYKSHNPKHNFFHQFSWRQFNFINLANVSFSRSTQLSNWKSKLKKKIFSDLRTCYEMDLWYVNNTILWTHNKLKSFTKALLCKRVSTEGFSYSISLYRIWTFWPKKIIYKVSGRIRNSSVSIYIHTFLWEKVFTFYFSEGYRDWGFIPHQQQYTFSILLEIISSLISEINNYLKLRYGWEIFI